MTNEQLFPNSDKVSVDNIFLEKVEAWSYKWNVSPEMKEIFKQMDKSIVNPNIVVNPLSKIT